MGIFSGFFRCIGDTTQFDNIAHLSLSELIKTRELLTLGAFEFDERMPPNQTPKKHSSRKEKVPLTFTKNPLARV